jgi:hypothetical protein
MALSSAITGHIAALVFRSTDTARSRQGDWSDGREPRVELLNAGFTARLAHVNAMTTEPRPRVDLSHRQRASPTRSRRRTR